MKSVDLDSESGMWPLGSFIRRANIRLQNLAACDIITAFPGYQPLAVQILFGISCASLGIMLRAWIDAFWEGAGPFGLMVPIVLIATLFGRWQAGVVTSVITSLHAWYFVLPIENSFAFAVASDGPRVIINILAAALVVALGELFRYTMQKAIADRELLLREIEHRVANNFSSVASLLRMQMRDHADDTLIASALQSALGRVESYALVNSFLYREERYGGAIDLRAYLQELCASLQASLVASVPVQIELDADNIRIDRDVAVTIGLLVNEVATNAAKHAFADKPKGTITVRLSGNAEGWRLDIADDGDGMRQTSREGSLGMRLISALATHISARIETASDRQGTRYAFIVRD